MYNYKQKHKNDSSAKPSINKAANDEVIKAKWNFYWANKDTLRRIRELNLRLSNEQMINHFPNHHEITRKDNLIKNINSFRRQMIRENNPLSKLSPDGSYYYYLDIIPKSFCLLKEWALFLEEFKKASNKIWIVKPASSARGQGIFLINSIEELKRKTLIASATSEERKKDKVIFIPALHESMYNNRSLLKYLLCKFIFTRF